jgi:hypothetical protein
LFCQGSISLSRGLNAGPPEYKEKFGLPAVDNYFEKNIFFVTLHGLFGAWYFKLHSILYSSTWKHVIHLVVYERLVLFHNTLHLRYKDQSVYTV